jgi:hypothetical protein
LARSAECIDFGPERAAGFLLVIGELGQRDLVGGVAGVAVDGWGSISAHEIGLLVSF